MTYSNGISSLASFHAFFITFSHHVSGDTYKGQWHEDKMDGRGIHLKAPVARYNTIYRDLQLC